MGILSLLLWTPALGSLLLAGLPGDKPHWVRTAAQGVAAVTLLLSLWLLGHYDPHNAALQLTEYVAVNPRSGSAYSLGVDGLSMPLLVLCTLLTSVALLASASVDNQAKAYHLCLLLLEFGMLGVLLAQDWVLFYIFWEVTLFPLFFLISRWGGKRRHTASLSFVFYTLTGSVFLLLSFLALSQYHLAANGSLMTALGHSAKAMPVQQQIWVLLGFFAGFWHQSADFPRPWLVAVRLYPSPGRRQHPYCRGAVKNGGLWFAQGLAHLARCRAYPATAAGFIGLDRNALR